MLPPLERGRGLDKTRRLNPLDCPKRCKCISILSLRFDFWRDILVAQSSPLFSTQASKNMWLLESQDGENDPDWVPIRFEQNSVLNSRYLVLDVLGKGTFGVVLKCADVKAKGAEPAIVAVKVSTGNSRKEFNNLKLAFAKKIPKGSTESFIVEPLNSFDLCATSRPQQKYNATVMALAESDLSSFISSSLSPFSLRSTSIYSC